MKYLEELLWGDLAKRLLKQIIAEIEPGFTYSFFDCFTSHAHPVQRYNLSTYLPHNLQLEVISRTSSTVLAITEMQPIVEVAMQPEVICCIYPELLCSADSHTLMTAKAQGADIRLVYTIEEALNLARLYPQRHIVFIATGFEGEMLMTAQALKTAKALNLHNFSIAMHHRLALTTILECWDRLNKERHATGIILPADFVGTSIVQYYSAQMRYQKPMVISGSEPIDFLQSLLYLIRQTNRGVCQLINQANHSLAQRENDLKQQLLAEVFMQQENMIKLQPEYMAYTLEAYTRLSRQELLPVYQAVACSFNPRFD